MNIQLSPIAIAAIVLGIGAITFIIARISYSFAKAKYKGKAVSQADSFSCKYYVIEFVNVSYVTADGQIHKRFAFVKREPDGEMSWMELEIEHNIFPMDRFRINEKKEFEWLPAIS